ncbi:MAG: SdrD B-like domain-containing protein, partial [Phycisphaeraceae bacterium]|nr:SdrD B-like domain-containing protein [Phycisphaeraceae bacterium]
DLDIYIEGPGGTHWPWTLDLNSPATAAVRTQGNHLDNVEQILIDAPAAGTYTVHIGHTGSSFTQAYSLLVSGVTDTTSIVDTRFLAAVVAGNVNTSPIEEASGLVASLLNTDVLWSHNDSGDSARFFGINTSGGFLGSFALSGAANIDFEDIAVGPGPTAGNFIYVGDIGDNGALRSTIEVYRVAEPTVTSSGGDQSATLTGVDTITLTYPSGARDAETMLVDPITGDLFVVTKRTQFNEIYRAAAPGAGSSSITLELMGQMAWGDGDFSTGTGYAGAVGGDVSSDGSQIIVKSYSEVYAYQRDIGSSVSEALITSSGVFNPLYTPEIQGEAIAFGAGGGFFTLTENFFGLSTVPLNFSAAVTGISGTKFNDLDGDGVFEPGSGETGIQGVTVFVDADDNGILGAGEDSDVTGPDGTYEIAGLSPGQHIVREVVPAGFTQTTPETHSVTVADQQITPDINFGNFGNSGLVTISGMKYEDQDGDGVKDAGEPGLQGWTIYIDANDSGTLDAGETSAVTNVSGEYEFTGLLPGTYIVAEVLPESGWQQTSPVPDGYEATAIAFTF